MSNRLKRLTLKHWLSIAFATLVVAYGLYQSRTIARGPSLAVSTPANGAQLDQPLIVVSGRAERIARLYLNGTPIFTDAGGNFREKLLLAPGYSMITLGAEDRFGRWVSRRLLVNF